MTAEKMSDQWHNFCCGISDFGTLEKAPPENSSTTLSSTLLIMPIVYTETIQRKTGSGGNIICIPFVASSCEIPMSRLESLFTDSFKLSMIHWCVDLLSDN